MKKIALTALLLALTIFAAGCGMKAAVQNKTREALGLPSTETAANAQSSGGKAPQADAKADAKSDAKPDAQAAPGTSKRPIATLPPNPSYEDMLENEWLNAPEEGYVWTMTISDVDEISVMGLATANYKVNLSASHIGPDMYGAYFGTFGFDYSVDLGGLSALLTLQGGSVDYDTDGWFENDKFVCKLEPYDSLSEEMLESVVSADYSDGMSAEELKLAEAYLGQFYETNHEEPFEKNSTADALWWSFNMPMTDGDMSAYFNMNGALGGLVDGHSEVDSSGKAVTSDVRVAFGLYASGGLVYKFDERYQDSETIENPIPYTIKVYPDNNVVMTIYSTTGPVTTKCYGKMTKVPVEQTQNVWPGSSK